MNIYNISGKYQQPFQVNITINELNITMEIDTGSAVSVVSEILFREKFSNAHLNYTHVKLNSYTGSPIEVLGFIYVNVEWNGQKQYNLPLYVIKKGGPPLMGRDWMHKFGINSNNIFNLSNNITCSSEKMIEFLASKFPDVFSPGLGKFTGGLAKLYLKPDAIPVFCRARSVPLALRGKIEKELIN